jgi:ribosomal protein S1
MYRSAFLVLILCGLVGVSFVEAHDASLHKGKPTQGEVVSVEDNGLQLKTATGTTTVTFREETKFERGDKKATREELKPGDQVSVFGTKLPTGELVAREVVLPATASKGDSHVHRADQNKDNASGGDKK